MSFDDAVEATVTRAEARREIEKHDLPKGEGWELFLVDVGDKPEYAGEEVLAWLGY